MTDSEATTTSFRRPPKGGAVTADHEALAKVMLEAMRSMVEEAQVAVGTVLEDMGGKIRVQMDDESGARELGMSRARGHRFNRGQRVPVLTARGGTQFVGHSISSGGGKDPVVGTPDMESGSVTNDILDPGVKNDISDAKSTANKAVDDARDANNAAKNAMDEAQSKADENHNHNMGDLPGGIATEDWVKDQLKDYVHK